MSSQCSSRAVALVLAIVVAPGLAFAEFVWPDGVGDFPAGHTLTAEDLNVRFGALGAWAMATGISTPCQDGLALVGDADEGTPGWRCDPLPAQPALPACNPGERLIVNEDGAWGCGPNPREEIMALQTRLNYLEERLDAAETRLIDEPLELEVCHDGCEFEFVSAALASLQGRRIAAGAAVTIRVRASDQEYAEPAELTLDHPDNAQIRIECGALDDTRDTRV